MATAEDTRKAIVDAIAITTRTDDHDTYMTYSTILDVHLSNASHLPHHDQISILTTLEQVFNDPGNVESPFNPQLTGEESLVEAIAWDVVAMLIPFLGRRATEPKATDVLTLLAIKGNAKEVFLKANEALKGIEWQPHDDDDDDDKYGDNEATVATETPKNLANADGAAEEIDPVKQVVALCHAIDITFKRIRTNRPARFLTSFGAALLLAVNQGFQSVSEHDDLATLHSLVLNFLDSMEELCTLCKEKGDEDDDLVKLIEGVITQYVPIYLGNQLLYWSGQYWEQSHPVISERPRSEDLVNEDLKADMDRILGLGDKINLSLEKLYGYLLIPPIDDSGTGSRYPEGDSVIPIDGVGCLLLLAHASTSHLPDVRTVLQQSPAKHNLILHQRLVADYLHGANLAVVDAMVLLGMLIESNLESRDLPPFTGPTDPAQKQFLEYIQAMSATAAICPSENLRPLIYSLVELVLDKSYPETRLYYILDTLDNCPYDNLRVAAISTLKKQFSKPANPLFESPAILEQIGPRLFRLSPGVLADEEEMWDLAGFILESLTLYQLLLLKKDDLIAIKEPKQVAQTQSAWLVPLRKAVEGWIQKIPKDNRSVEDGEKLSTWNILVENLDRIDDIVKTIPLY